MIIGLTGRVGSGKSQAQEIVKLNFRVQIIDLDQLGHKLLRDAGVKNNIISTFGDDILDGNDISRTKLGRLVFSSPDELAKLNAIVHPKMLDHVLDYSSHSELPVIVVGALIHEIGLIDHCDAVITINAEDEDIIAQIGEEKFNRARFQLSQTEFEDLADIVVDNHFDDMFEGDVIDAFSSFIS